MALRAYFEQENRFQVTDRLEIDDSSFSGTAIELTAQGNGFTFSHSDITSESNDKLLNLFANRIQVGKLDFKPRIDPNDSDELSLLEDIRDGDNRQFTLTWKRDGSVWWKGYVTTRIFSYPEKATEYTAQIRAEDFELLKGVDYTLDDTRQTFIQTFADIFSGLGYGLDIVTATSWITEDTTDSTDFLSQIYHETKALREFARTGDESDQPISKWEALERLCAPMLLIKQKAGAIHIDQLTEFDDPANVNETVYNPDGTVKTATTNVNRTQTGYTSETNGTPSVTVRSDNDSYPAMKRVRVKYDHRTTVINIKFPENLNLTSGSDTYSQFILSDGTQKLEFTIPYIDADFTGGPYNNVHADYRIFIDNGTTVYYWDEDEDDPKWTTSVITNEIPLTNSFGTAGGRGSLYVTTSALPADADGDLTIEVFAAVGTNIDSGLVTGADNTRFSDAAFGITNPIADENSTSIDYQLTQTDDYPESFVYEDSWFGDGPVGYSPGSLRHGSADSDTTADSWQRRGSTSYRNFHENALKESLDLQRKSTRKLEADIWGEYDPSKILSYDGNNYYYVGGTYTGRIGKWKATLVKVDVQTAPDDDFDDIPKFTDESGTGSGTITIGGGSAIDTSTLNSTYLEEAKNLGDLDSASDAISNLGITATASELNKLDGFTGTTANLNNIDGLSVDLGGLTASASELNILDGATLDINGNTISSSSDITLDATGDVFINGDTIKVDKEMTTTDNVVVLNDGETNSGITAGEAGLRFDRGTATDYEILFQEANGFFNIGKVGSLQAVATRPDSPDGNGLAIWNDTENWYETDPNLTYASGVLSTPQIDTGQGATDVYLMNQNLRDTDDVEFGGITFSNEEDTIEFESSSSTTSAKLYQQGADLFGSNNSFILSVGNDFALVLDDNDNGAGAFRIFDTDETSEMFTFDSDGIDIDGSTFVDASRNLTAGTGDFSDDLTFATKVSTNDYVSGILGQGAILDNTLSNGSFFEVDNMRVRKNFRTHIFVKDQVRATNGLLYVSDASEVAEEKTFGSTDTGVTLDVKAGTGYATFSVGDELAVKNIAPDGSSSSQIEFEVTSVDTTDPDFTRLTVDVLNSTSGTVYEGDTIVRTSGSAVLIDAETANSPFVDALVDGDVKARFGNVDGITNASGDGIWSANAYFTESITVGDLTKTNNYLDYQGSSLVLDTDDAYLNLGNGMEIDSGIGIDVGTDFWHNDGTFQYGGGVLTGTSSSVKLEAGTGDLLLDSSTKIFSLNDSTFGNTGIQLDYNSGAPRIFAGVNGGNYLQHDGTDLEFEATNTSLIGGTFTATDAVLTGKLTAGNVEVGQDITNALDGGAANADGFYANDNNYWYGDGNKKFGNSTNYVLFDQSTGYINLEAGNASIGDTSGWFGASDILSYTTSEVGLAGFTANSDYLRAQSGDTYVSMSILEYTGSSPTADQLRSNTGLYIYRDNTDVATADSFKLFRAGRIADEGTHNDFSTNEWGVQIGTGETPTDFAEIFRVDSTQARIASAYFDETELWGGDANKANASIRLDFDNQEFILGIGGVIRNNNSDFIIDSNGIDITTIAPNGKLGISANSSVRFAEYSDGFGGQVGVYNSDSTASTKDEARLYLRGGEGIHIDPELGYVKIENLPTSAPSESNMVWNDGGTLKIT